MNKRGTQSPKGEKCAKCGEEIPCGIGRRYRMKWMHEHCLPATRLARIDHYREEESSVIGKEMREKRLAEEREELRHKLNKLQQMKVKS